MNFGLSLLDDSDQDELERLRRENEMLATLQQPDDYLPPPAAAFQPPAHAEMAPLQLDTGPDWSDALGAGTTALAALADLGLNHGRGTGQILAAGGQFGQARAEQRLKQTQDALSYEEKRAALDRQNKYNDYLYANMAQRGQNQAAMQQTREANLGLRGRDIAVKEANSSRADAKVARETDAASDYAQNFRQWQYDNGMAEPGSLDQVSFEQMKAANPALLRAYDLAHAGDKAASQTTGRITAENRLAAETGAAKATELDAQTDVRAKQAGAEAAAREQSTGAAERAEANARQGRYNKFRDETEKTRPQVGIAARLDQVLAKHKGDTPGVGVWDSFKSGKLSSDDDLAVRGALANMTDLVARVRSGAAIPPKEFDNIARFVDGGEGATEQQFRVAYGAYKQSLQQEIREQSKGRESEARDVLGEYGSWALGAPPPAPGPTYRASPGGGAATARSGAMGQVGGMSSGSTGGAVRATPNPDGTFTVPGGSRPYTAGEIQKLIAKGLVAPL